MALWEFLNAVKKGKAKRVKFSEDNSALQLTAVNDRRATIIISNDLDLSKDIFLSSLMGQYNFLQLSSLHQSKWRWRRRSYFRSKCYKWRRRSCFSCSCLQSKYCQGRDDFENCCILPKFCTCSCPSYPSIDSNEYIWWKANARETKEELIDREPKFLD
ncbi:uncharacterized protein LOC110269590 [Arachis ipaensis]|uniref:uncharacterized protein LOC110269590 n=1 Tax=Arachis ipaensis TaxID=130454 RepID=UPI000A2B8ED3|nr:uncharacterized protein LOC110269590 [Arachis ipaensis]